MKKPHNSFLVDYYTHQNKILEKRSATLLIRKSLKIRESNGFISGRCFYNASKNVIKGGFYAEGFYTIEGLPELAHHAWSINCDQSIIDPIHNEPFLISLIQKNLVYIELFKFDYSTAKNYLPGDDSPLLLHLREFRERNFHDLLKTVTDTFPGKAIHLAESANQPYPTPR